MKQGSVAGAIGRAVSRMLFRLFVMVAPTFCLDSAESHSTIWGDTASEQQSNVLQEGIRSGQELDWQDGQIGCGLNQLYWNSELRTKAVEELKVPKSQLVLPPLFGYELEQPRKTVDEIALVRQAVSLGELLASVSELSLQGTTASLASYASGVGLSMGAQLAESWFDQFGKARIDLKLDDEFSFLFYEFDYFMPYYNGEKATAFMQLGFHNWAGRDMRNLGLGYRRFNSSWMFGVNAFVDQDLTLDHQRYSFGFEAMTSHVKGYSNVYSPLSEWQKASRGLEARAATGIDVGVDIQVDRVPGLSLSAGCFQWFGDHVDVAGGFDGNTKPGALYELAENPTGVKLGIKYRPIPLLGFTLERIVGDKYTRNTSLGMDLILNFDTGLSGQLSLHDAGSLGSLESMRKSLVERESNVILSYRESGSRLSYRESKVDLEVTVESSYSVVEKSSLPIAAKAANFTEISSVQWGGRGAQMLDDQDTLTPVFTADYWDPIASKNVYDLTVTVTDTTGREGSASTEVIVLENPQLQPVIVFTDSVDQPLSSLSLVQGSPSFQLNCIVQSQRQLSDKFDQNSYAWQGDTILLSADNVPDPLVFSNEPVDTYELSLTVQMQTGETGSGTLPVSITQGVP